MNENKFSSYDIDELLIGETLPFPIYVYIDFKFITYRAKGNELTRLDYDRFTQKKLRHVFINQNDVKIFQDWKNKYNIEESKNVILPNLKVVREDAHRKMMDIFQSKHPDKVVAQAIEVSKRLVHEVMKNPHVSRQLNSLQTYSKGTIDHSVNVSVLSTYLGMQIGYSHSSILEHLGTGALLHDIGKSSIELEDSDPPSVIEEKLRNHPVIGRKILEKCGGISEEVLRIVSEQQEFHDGTGYPNNLKHNNIYDLARIVSISNNFDELVGNGKGTLQDRQRYAIDQMENVLYAKFDPVKLKKCLKVLKLGI